MTGLSGAQAYLRRLVNDPDSKMFQPADLQHALDETIIDVPFLLLHSIPSYAAGGIVEYKIFTSPRRDLRWFSDDTNLLDSQFNPLVPDFSDLDSGRWEFLTTQPNATVYVAGKSYDPYGAASSLLQELAGTFSDAPSSFSVLNGSFSYQESKRKGPMEMSRMYANKARHATVDMLRGDANTF